MDTIFKWSQNIKISVVVYALSLILSFAIPPFVGNGAFISALVLVISMLIYFGLSKALKLENANISSTLFIIGSTQLFYFLGDILTNSPINIVFTIIYFILPFVLFKYIFNLKWLRAIWLNVFFGIVVGIFIVIIGSFILPLLINSENKGKPTSEQVSPEAYVNSKFSKDNSQNSVDLSEFSKAKMMFPSWFILPEDQNVTEAIIIEPIPEVEIGGGSIISYKVQEDSLKIITDYSNLMKNQGLNVGTGRSKPGEQSIYGEPIPGTPQYGTIGFEQIRITVTNLPDDYKQITFSLNK